MPAFWRDVLEGRDSTYTTIMGEIAYYTGKPVTWDEMMAPDFELEPKLADVRRGVASGAMSDYHRHWLSRVVPQEASLPTSQPNGRGRYADHRHVPVR
jgi:hypothetical protein